MNRSVSKSRAFTLLEVMVALAIMFLMLATVWDGLAQGILLTEGLAQRTVARWVAQNRIMLRQAREEWPQPRTYTGSELMGGETWYWEEQITQTEEPLLRRITVRVGTAPDTLSLFSLEGYLQRPRPPVSFPRRRQADL